MTPAMIALLKQQEGLSLIPYRDTVGVLTIGYGTNLDQGITVDQASYLLQSELIKKEVLLRSFPWFMSLSDIRRDAVSNMAYNMGVSGVLEFRHMIAAIEAGDYETASAEMLNSKWAGQVGERAHVLAAIMKNGALP